MFYLVDLFDSTEIPDSRTFKLSSEGPNFFDIFFLNNSGEHNTLGRGLVTPAFIFSNKIEYKVSKVIESVISFKSSIDSKSGFKWNLYF